MLTPEEKHDIDHEVAIVPVRAAACIEALKAVQRRRRWVDDETLADLAAYLEMSRDELDSVATFYNLVFRRPVGRHIIRFCDSVSCWLLENERLRDAITSALGVRFGETTADDRFTFLPIQCLGCCDHAPALMIDDDLYRDVTPEGVPDILAKYR